MINSKTTIVSVYFKESEMLTSMPISSVFNKLCEKRLEIDMSFLGHRPKKIVDFYDHLCSMERHLRMSHKLGADVVYLNQAEVETLTTNFSVFKG